MGFSVRWATLCWLCACSESPAEDAAANAVTGSSVTGATAGLGQATNGSGSVNTSASGTAAGGVGPSNSANVASVGAGGSASGLSTAAATTGGPDGSSTETASSTGGTPGETSTGGGAGGTAGTASSQSSSTGGGSVDGVTIVPDPSWACGMPDGIVDPTLGELVFRGSLDVGEVREVGDTPYGTRRVTDITGGDVGDGTLEATFLGGGLDFELTLSNGASELEQVAMLRAADGTLIYLRTCGVAPSGDSVVRIVPDFEVANSSSLAWLNTGTFVGTRTLDQDAGTLEVAVYDVSMLPAAEPKLELEDPPEVADQPWDCLKLTGSKGAEVFTETVLIGSSLSVGASKNGTRNVIPITGGTVTGAFTGSVVSAGADYQLLGGTATLDARYVLESNDGEFVIVRNCGPFGGLVPLFETRSDGAYAFLNSNMFLSSDPGSAAGGVSITFYELN